MDVNKIIEESINNIIGATEEVISETETTETTEEQIEENVVSDNLATKLSEVDPAKTGALAAAVAAGLGAVGLAKKLRSARGKRFQASANLTGLAPKLSAGEKAAEKVAGAAKAAADSTKSAVKAAGEKAKSAGEKAKSSAKAAGEKLYNAGVEYQYQKAIKKNPYKKSIG